MKKVDRRSKAPKISVAFADDAVLLRQLLSRELEAEGDIHISISVANGLNLLQALENAVSLPQVCLIDARMPIMDGFETITLLRKKWPEIKVLVLSDYAHSGFIDHMKWKGAHDYLSKNTMPPQIAQAIRAIAGGHKPEAGLFTQGPPKAENKQNLELLGQLSAKELVFLKLSATNLSNEEIKTRMKVSKASGEGYRSNLFRKFNVKTRLALTIAAMRMGYISFDPDQNQDI